MTAIALSPAIEAAIRANLTNAPWETNLQGFGPVERGKVRDNYRLPKHRRLIVARDSLSAFDRILGYVPYKGQVLNQLATWWFGQMNDVVANHFVEEIDPNAMLVKEIKPLPFEAIVRGFLTGVTETSLWRMYKEGKRYMYGQNFPNGMVKNKILPNPVFTPTTKAPRGKHDAPLSPADLVTEGYIDAALLKKVMNIVFALFKRGQRLAAAKGLILVDTKYELGLGPEGVVVIDEIHTPDSSRYWRAETYEDCLRRGVEPDILDKEYVRMWYVDHGFRGDGEAPTLPMDIISEAARRYIYVYEQLTGVPFEPAIYPVEQRLVQTLNERGLR